MNNISYISYFSSNNFPLPHPEIMVIDKDQAIQTGDLLTPTGTYFKIKLDEPYSVSSDKEPGVILYEIPDTWFPMR